ncbi:hypothetical protein PVAP13_5KG401707 [Panicum virgatum]|uniref:DUF7769 domain-containing protein n=1 Tax=Panicum virgatum TaxID=38727 RepID=A0A8T0SRR1_PANVG|nr:hypothetical protein PVAP13_5KG401707 [Panicum virgatum]
MAREDGDGGNRHGVQEQGDGVASGGGDESAAGQQGSNVKKRRYYSDDLKIAIYQELLAKTHPPVLHRGVSKAVALKFGVPLRLVQSVWRNGQDYGGIEGVRSVRNKYVKNCGRKKVEIDMEAIKDVPLGERKTIKDLANALGVKKSTL